MESNKKNILDKVQDLYDTKDQQFLLLSLQRFLRLQKQYQNEYSDEELIILLFQRLMQEQPINLKLQQPKIPRFSKLDREFYLCPPLYCDQINYADQEWMKKALGNQTEISLSDKNRSIYDEWTHLYFTYQTLIPEECLHILAPKQDLKELTFFGDGVFAINKVAVYSRMRNKSRYPETEYVIERCQKLGFLGQRVPEGQYFEGSGETMMWNGKIFAGQGQRSSIGIEKYIQSIYPQYEVIGLKLKETAENNNAYHLDCAFLPIRDNLIALYKPAFDQDQLNKIIQIGEKNKGFEIIEVDDDEAANLATNCIVIEDIILCSRSCQKFIQKLKGKGLTVIDLDMTHYNKLGGGIKCLTWQHYF